MNNIKKKNELVSCGFNKWSIGVSRTNGYAVTIEGSHWSLGIAINLFDASGEDFRNLANMFSKIADECEDPKSLWNK